VSGFIACVRVREWMRRCAVWIFAALGLQSHDVRFARAYVAWGMAHGPLFVARSIGGGALGAALCRAQQSAPRSWQSSGFEAKALKVSSRVSRQACVNATHRQPIAPPIRNP
jgi:hypothetical protein